MKKKFLAVCLTLWLFRGSVYAVATDCLFYAEARDIVGAAYKAVMVEQSLPNSGGWLLLFGGCGFTGAEGASQHFIDLMIKANMSQVHDDRLCGAGFLQTKRTLQQFGFEIGLSDYEDCGGVTDNDIAMICHDPLLFPRRFSNIDAINPNAPDKIMADYQVPKGGNLEGKEVLVTLERGEETRIPKDTNAYMDPDDKCRPASQADIMYRKWRVRFEVPENRVDTSVDLYVNARQAEFLKHDGLLNFIWENQGPISTRTDRFKVLIYDVRYKTSDGIWHAAERFYVDQRTPRAQSPLGNSGELLAGFRRAKYCEKPALEASFGYAYTDYARDGDLFANEKSRSTMGVVDLTGLADVELAVKSAAVSRIRKDLKSGGTAHPPKTGKELLDLLADDQWATQWRLISNLGNNFVTDAWIEDFTKPVAKFGYLQVDNLKLPKGLLVMHPEKSDTPARLTRTFVVPRGAETKLHIGGFRRNGGAKVTVACRVYGEEVWAQELLADLQQFHQVIDLTACAGNPVEVSIIIDSKGEWVVGRRCWISSGS